MTVPWPMNIMTREAGEHRKLITHPKKIVDRRYISPEGECIEPSKILIPDGEYYVEVKEQGHFHIYARDEWGIYTLYGRRQGVDGNYNDVYNAIRDSVPMPEIPKCSAIAVELIWPGHPDSSVPTAIKDCPHLLEIVALGIAIYDGHIYQENNISYLKSRSILEEIFGVAGCAHLLDMREVDQRNKGQVISNLLHEAKCLGIEGFVLKRYAYDEWWKIKGIAEADVFITGFKVSDSDTYRGMVTAIEIGVYSNDGEKIIDMGNVSGFSDDEKSAMTTAYQLYGTDESNPYIFKVLRVTYQERSSRGKLKHGFFNAWRTDKDETDCTEDQFD